MVTLDTRVTPSGRPEPNPGLRDRGNWTARVLASAIPISRQIATQGSTGLTSVDFHYNSQHSQFRDSGMNSQLSIAKSELAAFCRAHGIRRLSVFGSALREDFGPESEVDVLVEFERDRIPELLGVAGMEIELSAIFGNRKIDLRTAEDLSHYFRQDIDISQHYKKFIHSSYVLINNTAI